MTHGLVACTDVFPIFAMSEVYGGSHFSCCLGDLPSFTRVLSSSITQFVLNHTGKTTYALLSGHSFTVSLRILSLVHFFFSFLSVLIGLVISLIEYFMVRL